MPSGLLRLETNVVTCCVPAAPLQDRVADRIGDVDVSGAVNRHAIGEVEAGNQGGELLRGSVPFFDGVVVGVGDVEVAGRIHSEAKGAGKVGGNQRGKLLDPGIPFLDAAIVEVGDKEVARSVDGNPGRLIQAGDHRRELLRVRVPLLDGIVCPIGDEDVAGIVNRQSPRTGQVGRDQRGDLLSGGVPFLDRVVERIGNVDVAGPINRHVAGRGQVRVVEGNQRIGRDIAAAGLGDAHGYAGNRQRASSCGTGVGVNREACQAVARPKWLVCSQEALQRPSKRRR